MSGKLRFAVTGMTCAACSARVEKATAGVSGVSGVAVNLLKNSMEVQLGAEADPVATSAAIVSAVEKAGYGAFPAGEGAAAGPGAASAAASAGAANPAAAAQAERKSVLQRLIISLVFTVPLFYISMGDMFGWPLPSVLTGMENMMVHGLVLFCCWCP